MNGTAETQDVRTLEAGFAQFVLAARELEASYAALKLRADAVDLQLQQSNRALERSLAEREAVFSALPIGLVTLREDGSVGACNREGTRLLEVAATAGVELLARGAGECTFDGFVVRVRRVDLPQGELVLLEDRSRLEELEAEVVRLDRLAGLSELALGVAHEIKNPLNGVLGFANLIERSDDAFAIRRYAGRVADGVRAVDDIVKALLGFARPADKPEHRASIETVVERCAASANLPRSRWQLHGSAAARAATVDADALGRVVANLVRNAVEASPDVQLGMRVRLLQNRLELLFEDDGPGVASGVAAQVFEPFVSTKQGGTGLGLALSARVLAYLGGELELLNPGEPGARFRVRVPIAAAPAPAREVGA